MRNFIMIFLAIFILPRMGTCDVVKLETNTWKRPYKLIWTCTLEKIDGKSGIAYFTFQNKGNTERFAVHITRIYSLTLDDDTDPVNKPFPETLKDLKTELPINPHAITHLELNNKTNVVQDIPEEVSVSPDRKSIIVYLKGDIIQANLEKVMLRARNVKDKGDTSEFEIKRSELMKWIR